jgi:NAD-dependent DNA ligase
LRSASQTSAVKRKGSGKTVWNIAGGACGDARRTARIPDVGEIVAQSVLSFFSDPSIAAQIDALLAHGVSPGEEQTANALSPIAGKTIVVTGTLPTLGRREAETLIEQNGAKAAGSVSKNTDFVLYGENAGSKLDKARALQIPLLTEAELLELIGSPRRDSAELAPLQRLTNWRMFRNAYSGKLDNAISNVSY